MSHCLVTEAVDYSVKHPLVCGTVFGDVTAVLSKVPTNMDLGSEKWVADLELERAPSIFFM